MCYNAVDRHVESGRGEQPAIIYDSPVTGTKQVITFRELQDQVTSIIKFNIFSQLRELSSTRTWITSLKALPGLP